MRLVGIVILVLLGVSFLWILPALADSLAVLRPQLIAVLAILGFLQAISVRHPFAMLLIPCLIGGATNKFSAGAGPLDLGPQTLSLYQKNLHFSDSELDLIADDIDRAAPDFVTFQELSDRNLNVLGDWISHFPSHVVCKGSEKRGVAILTSHTIVEGTSACHADLDFVLAQIEIGERRVWVASVHLLWPFPYRQFEQAEAIAGILSKVEGDIIVAGDFNMIARGNSVRRIAKASRTFVAGNGATTFPRFSPIVPLTIDHVMVPNGVKSDVEIRHQFGSDHNGLLASLSF